MAVITFDVNKNSISVLVEKTDAIHTKDDNVLTVGSASQDTAGKIYVNGAVQLCMVRGERG